MSTPGQIETEAETTAVPGERLRLAREALKLSQQDVAQRLRIGVDKVAALEIDDIARVGAPVFAAGYIRAYARIVGLPADELIPQFEGLGHLRAHPAALTATAGDGGLERLSAGLPAAFSRGNGRRKGGGLRMLTWGGLFLAMAAAGLWVLQNDDLPLPPSAGLAVKPPPQESAPADAPSQPRATADTGSGPQALAIPLPAEEEPAPAAGGEAPALVPDSPPAGEPAVVADTPAAMDEAAMDETAMDETAMNELSLYFQEDSWVEVRDARGERLMHRLARAGQARTLRGVAPFAVVLGYVPGVTIILDGEAVDLGKYQGRRLARFSVGADTANEN